MQSGVRQSSAVMGKGLIMPNTVIGGIEFAPVDILVGLEVFSCQECFLLTADAASHSAFHGDLDEALSKWKVES